MASLFRRHSPRLALLTPIVILGLLGVSLLYARIDQARDRAYLYEVAHQLGYTEADHVSFHIRRRGFLGETPTMSLIFTTDQSMTTFETTVQATAMPQIEPRNASGFEIFSVINSHTDRRLTANGNDGRNTQALPLPHAHGWTLRDGEGHAFTVYFYEFVDADMRYELDGQPLPGNLVELLLFI